MQIGATPPTAPPKMPVETIIAAIALPIIQCRGDCLQQKKKEQAAESNLHA